MVTITALVSSGITDSSLTYHLQTARKNGITRTEIAEILTQVGFYAGWPKAWAAFRLAKDVWTEETKGGGQLLVCVAGTGRYQEWGKPARLLRPGDVVNIPAGVKHWHGATADSWFAHLAIEVPGEKTSNEWLEPVTDEEYNKLQEEE